jgi:hypothetical protein
MCAQPADPAKVNNNHTNVPAPVEMAQAGSTDSGPSKQRRPRIGADGAGRNLVVRGVRRDPPNMHKLARVVASLAASMSAEETGQQPACAEPDASAASPRDDRRDAA